MKAKNIIAVLVLICGPALNASQTTTTTPTNGPTTVIVRARTTDGKPAVGVEVIDSPPQNFNPIPTIHGNEHATVPLLSSFYSNFDSTSEEWTFTNVPPGYYGVELDSTNYVYNVYNKAGVFVFAGTNYTVEVVLSNGATYKGRLLDDVTGKPIANERFFGGYYMFQYVYTDAEGRYEWRHVKGDAKLDLLLTNYVEQEIKFDAADEDSTVLVPDIRLQPGGRISGRVERPASLTSNTYAWVQPELQGALATNSQIKRAWGYTNGTFRTDPLPPGTYKLNAEWVKGLVDSPVANGSVSNIKVTVGRESKNVFIRVK